MTQTLSVQEYRKMASAPKKSKYKNVKYVLYDKDGNEATKQVFDSKKEMQRWGILETMKRQGIISDLRRQVKFKLIPAQYADVSGKTKCIEKSCSYYADFVYKNKEGYTVVEDTKGFLTPEYRLKRKLMFWVHGIQIKEV